MTSPTFDNELHHNTCNTSSNVHADSIFDITQRPAPKTLLFYRCLWKNNSAGERKWEDKLSEHHPKGDGQRFLLLDCRAQPRACGVFASRTQRSHGGFYFVRAMNLYSEMCFAKRYDFGCNFRNREGRNKSYIQNGTV